MLLMAAYAGIAPIAPRFAIGRWSRLKRTRSPDSRRFRNGGGVFPWKRCITGEWMRAPKDFAVLRHVHEQTFRAVPDRLFAMLGDLKQDTAYNITRYDHCLQAATRALRDNRDDEYVAVALLHDVASRLARSTTAKSSLRSCDPSSAATITGCWMQHGLFQTYFYARHMGLDPNARDISSPIRRMSRRSSSAPNTTKCPSTPTTRTSHYRPSSRWSVGCFRKNGSPRRRCRRPDKLRGGTARSHPSPRLGQARPSHYR